MVFGLGWNPGEVGFNRLEELAYRSESKRGQGEGTKFLLPSCYVCYHQKVWPNFRLNVPVPNDLTTKRNLSSKHTTAWISVGSRCGQVDNQD